MNPYRHLAIVLLAGAILCGGLVSSALAPQIGGLPPVLQALVVSVGIVCLLTWIVMPLLVKLFSPLLQRAPKGGNSDEISRTHSP